MSFYSHYNIDPLWCWEWLPSSWVKLKILSFQYLWFVCAEIYIIEYADQAVGIAQWSSTSSWSNGCKVESWKEQQEIFFLLVNFLCWLLCQYLFHPCVTAVAGKRSWSFCQKCRWQVAAKHTCTLHLWLQMKWHYKEMHGCMMYTECVPRRQQFYVAPAMWQPNSTVSTPVQWIFKMRCMWPVTH